MKKKSIISSFFLGVVAVIVFSSSSFFSYHLLKKYNPPLTSYLKLLMPKLHVIYSGSMEPAVKTGSVTLSIPSNNYYKGDIITFEPNSVKGTITHRIEAKLYPDSSIDNPTYLTSGDANEDIDSWEVANDQIMGKVILTVPYLGYVANFAKTPQGFILFVLVPATIFIYEEIKSLFVEIKNRVPKFKKGKEVINLVQATSGGLPKAAIFVPVIGAVLVIASFTLGFFSDTETSLGNILGAAASFMEPPEEFTICHAAGRADEPANFVTLTLPWNAIYGPGGHFNEDGTPQAGHEEDYFGECNSPEPEDNPIIEATPSSHLPLPTPHL